MEDGFDSVSQGKLVDNFLLRLVKVDLPGVFARGIWQLDIPRVLITKVMEEVLVEASVLDVVGRHLTEEKKNSFNIR